jgi:hypothetical protein
MIGGLSACGSATVVQPRLRSRRLSASASLSRSPNRRPKPKQESNLERVHSGSSPSQNLTSFGDSSQSRRWHTKSVVQFLCHCVRLAKKFCSKSARRLAGIKSGEHRISVQNIVALETRFPQQIHLKLQRPGRVLLVNIVKDLLAVIRAAE